MDKEERYERLSEDPSLFIDKAKIHRQSSAEAEISPEQRKKNLEATKQAELRM